MEPPTPSYNEACFYPADNKSKNSGNDAEVLFLETLAFADATPFGDNPSNIDIFTNTRQADIESFPDCELLKLDTTSSTEVISNTKLLKDELSTNDARKLFDSATSPSVKLFQNESSSNSKLFDNGASSSNKLVDKSQCPSETPPVKYHSIGEREKFLSDSNRDVRLNMDCDEDTRSHSSDYVLLSRTGVRPPSPGADYTYQNCSLVYKDSPNDVKYFWKDGQVQLILLKNKKKEERKVTLKCVKVTTLCIAVALLGLVLLVTHIFPSPN